METLDTLRAERDEARRISVALLIADIVMAHYRHDLREILLGMNALVSCPYPEAHGVIDVGLALGNFLAGISFVGEIEHASSAEPSIFGAKQTRAAA